MHSSHVLNTSSLLDSETQKKINLFTKDSSYTIKQVSNFLVSNFSIDITVDKDIINGYNHDWSNMLGYADALCRPKNSFECAIIIRICYLLKIPITMSAGRTNLTGSATPNGGIIISIEKMKDITNFNLKDKKISVSPGVYLEDLRNEVISKSEKKLIFPVDPTSRKEAMLGGAVSCNASGFVPGEKGSMRYWVSDIDFILPNGSYIKVKRGQYISKGGKFTINYLDSTQSIINVPKYKRVDLKNASGPFSSENGKLDFVDLIVGSEGIFGCITNITLKLQDAPNDHLNLFIKLKDEDDAFSFYSYIKEKLNRKMSALSGFEYFGDNCSSFMHHHEHFFSNNYNVGVYMQIPLFNQKIDYAIEKWYKILMNFEYINEDEQVLSLNDPNNWKTFFEARHSIPANALQKSKEYNTASIITDTIVPPDSFNEFIKKTHKLIKSQNIDYLLFGHLGDCHLHFHLIPSMENEKDAIECYREIIRISAKLGGVYSAEHGTGKRKKQDLIECYGDIGISQIVKCKEGFDPDFLFNSGNVVDK